MAAWILGIASSAVTSVFSPGDVIIAGQPVCVITCPPCLPPSGIDVFSSTGSFLRQIADPVSCGDPNDALMLGSDILLANGNRIDIFRSDGTLIPFASGFPELITSLAIDEHGTIFAGQNLRPIITKFDSTGRLLGSFTVPTAQSGILTMDLGADQCTLFYSSGTSVIKRFDVCRNVPLSDFLDLGNGYIAKLRVVPDGGVLAATDAAIMRISAGGTIASLLPPGRYAVSVPTAESVWVGSGEQLEKISLTTGAVTAGPVSTPDRIPVDFILVVGEQRAAQAAADIPDLNFYAEIALIALLGVIATMRLTATRPSSPARAAGH